MAFFTTLLLV